MRDPGNEVGELIRNLYLFPGAFCFQGKDKSFSIFTGSLLRGPENLSSQINRDHVCAPGLCSFFHIKQDALRSVTGLHL